METTLFVDVLVHTVPVASVGSLNLSTASSLFVVSTAPDDSVIVCVNLDTDDGLFVAAAVLANIRMFAIIKVSPSAAAIVELLNTFTAKVGA